MLMHVSIMDQELIDTNSNKEDLMKIAVQFLQNPRVRDSSHAHKEAFLKKKGLDDEEIRIAFHRAGVSSKHDDLQVYQQPHGSTLTNMLVVKPSYWSQWQNVCKTIFIVSGISCGVYYLFDKYFGPLLWGSRDRLRSIEESLEALDQTLASTRSEIQESLRQMSDSLARQQMDLCRLSGNQSDLAVSAEHISKLESEVSSIKGLLLSRRQFPTVPVSTSPGIPAWQLRQENEENSNQKDSSGDSGDPSPVSNGTSSPELVERVEERAGSE